MPDVLLKESTNLDEGAAQSPPAPMEPNIAVLIPCFNESVTIQSVIVAFRHELPSAKIYVYDNNSTDRTFELAKEADAIVRREHRQGKGYVVRRMFADIEADCYILVDGDGTYDPSVAINAVSTIVNEACDFVNVARRSSEKEAYRPGHRFGNWLLTELVRLFFGLNFMDMLSGYKAMSRRFVKSFPALSTGFEIETELAVHALEMRMPMVEFPGAYKERPSGSVSKLRTYRDGFRILFLIARLIKDERPLQSFAALGFMLVLLSLILGLPVILEFVETGFVPRFPTAILSVGLIILGWLCIFTGLILDVVTKARREIKRLAYLSVLLYVPN